MRLLLSVISVYNRPPGQKMEFTFDEKGGTIGRKNSNSWVLPDQQRHLSGTHAKIEYDGQQFYIVDTSTNGVFIDGNPKSLGKTNRRKLDEGMRLVMGGYQVEVFSLTNNGIGNSREVTESDPFSDFDGDSDFQKPAKRDDSNGFTDNSFMEENSAKHKLPLQTRTDSEDPFFGLGEFSSSEKEEVPDDEYQSSSIPELDSFFKPPDVIPDKKRVPTSENKKEKNDVNIIPDDWGSEENDSIDDLLTGINDPFLTHSNTDNKKSETSNSGRSTPPKTSPNNLDTTDEKADVAEETNNEAFEAFLKGAGLEISLFSDNLSSQHMELVGVLFRSAIQGTMEVLQSRAEIKNEMRMDMTTVQPVQNNPIKFSVDINEALKRLLIPQAQSFMDPEQAILEAFDDIKAHQIAIIAGIQACLVHVLKRFEPDKLMHRLEKESPISSNIPIHRQSKLWEKFEELYEAIEGEAEDDFNRLFGQEFAKAYDEQIERLKIKRKI